MHLQNFLPYLFENYCRYLRIYKTTPGVGVAFEKLVNQYYELYVPVNELEYE
jgi:hypothetical protein